MTQYIEYENGKATVKTAVLDNANAQKTALALRDGINAPYKNIGISMLGGSERATMMVTLSLDPKRLWINGIFENSRCAYLSLQNDGTLEMFSAHYKLKRMRKCKVKSYEHALRKINDWIAKTTAIPL